MQLTGDAGSGSSRSGEGGLARGGRVVREGDVGAGRPAATAAAGPGHRRMTRYTWVTRTWARSRSADRIRSQGPAKDTASRRAIFVCQPPKAAAEERACAAKILSRMARLAYRRPVTKADADTLLEFFDNGRQDGGSFDSGIQFALERMLVDPDFLLRVVRDPADAKRTAAYPSQRSGTGLAPVVLPVEQHPRRSPAGPGRTRRAHAIRRPWKRKCGACWPIRAPPMRW